MLKQNWPYKEKQLQQSFPHYQLCSVGKGWAQGTVFFVCLFYWSVVALQCRVSACCTTRIRSMLHACPPRSFSPAPPSPSSRSSQRAEPSSCCYAAACPGLSVSYVVVYICQCFSLSSSRPLLPARCSWAHSPRLHLFLLANRFISTIFPDAIYVCCCGCCCLVAISCPTLLWPHRL